jgi:hypothetical protein
MNLNTDVIISEIVASGISPVAAEAGAGLVDAWISEKGSQDIQRPVAAVELGFILWLDDLTVAIGVQDAVFQEPAGYLGGEWKSAKEPKKDGRGRETAWWNEDVWRRELGSGPQIGLYALALQRATYIERKTGRQFQFKEPNPRILIRAAVKSNPVRFWPSDPTDPETPEIFTFDQSALDSIANGVRAKAAQIRCARRANIQPWQLPGDHCFTFGRTCQFFDTYCSKRNHPVTLEGNDKLLAKFDTNDPAAQAALPHVDPEKLANPDLVIISASQYKTASSCLEKYRIQNGSMVEDVKESSLALETGSAMHTGLAEFYRQVQTWQEKTA